MESYPAKLKLARKHSAEIVSAPGLFAKCFSVNQAQAIDVPPHSVPVKLPNPGYRGIHTSLKTNLSRPI